MKSWPSSDEERNRSIGFGSRCLAGCLAGIFMISLACAKPGQLYRVAPEIQGTIVGGERSEAEAELHLNIMSREVPTLFDVKTTRLSPNLSFRFDAASLVVAGHEYSKVYRAYLHYRVGAKDQVIWRGEFSRTDLRGPIELDCDLNRPARLGQPCWVRDPLTHPWLVTNGERTFNRLCAECHGRGGRGGEGGRESERQGPSTSTLGRIAPRLDQIAATRPNGFDREEIAEFIEGSSIPREHGPRSMPIWGERLSADYARYSNTDELVGATLDPVIVYLLSIQRAAGAGP